MRRTTIFAAALAAAAVLWPAAGHARGTHFTAHVTNPYLPFLPGSQWVYRGEKDGKPGRDVVTVSHRTATIDGVPCAVILDRLYLDGHLAERTTDYYTQNRNGTVWYYGEDTAELDRHGHVTTTDGSWRAGRDGAIAGVFMPAHPRVGQAFRQEFLKGHADDHFQILSRHATITVPLATYRRHVLLTKEWTPLEPGVLDHKWYVRGVGDVAERTVRGGSESWKLASYRRG